MKTFSGVNAGLWVLAESEMVRAGNTPFTNGGARKIVSKYHNQCCSATALVK